MNSTKNQVGSTTMEDKINDTGAKLMLKATNAVGKALNKRWGKVLLVLPLCISMLTVTVSASGGADAEGFIDSVIELLQTWIPRLGGMVIVVGGIQFGLGFKDDNADQKTRGMQCMIGGAIVAAIAKLINF